MMKSWRGSFVGPTLKGSFTLSTCGSKLKNLMSKEVQPDNADMHADTAAGVAFQSFPASYSEMHDRTDWHRCHLHWYREG